MQKRTCLGRLYLLPLVALVTSCASYTDPAGSAVADVYVQTSLNVWEADPSIAPSILAFRAGADGNLIQVQALRTSEFMMIAQGGMVLTSDYAARAIHQYAIAQDGSLSGPVSTLYPANYDSTGCGPQTGHGMLDPTGTYLTIELENQGCDVWQTYRLQQGGTYQFLGQDSSSRWIVFKGGVSIGSPGRAAMSKDGRYAYGLEGIEGWTSLVAMKRDSSGVMRIWDALDWPYDTQYQWQPGSPLTDANNHMVLPMSGETNANWTRMGVASFGVDPSTGNLQAISTYANMPTTQSGGAAYSPEGDYIAVAGDDGSLRTFQFHDDGPATPSAVAQLPPGQWPTTMVWDTSHHLYMLTQTSLKQPAIAQFSLYVFTAADGQLKLAPGSPRNVPNANGLLVMPRS